MSVICLGCEGWGCAQCKSEREAAKGGEQGASPLEVELAGLRAEVSRLLQDGTRLTLQRDAAEQLVVDQLALIHELKAERDRLLAELALFRVPGGAA